MPGSLRAQPSGVGLSAGIALLFGALIGLAIPVFTQFETRWIVYILAGTFFAAIFVFVRNRTRFLWATLILSLQLAVYLRVLHGHAGSEGIAVSLTTLLAICAFLWLLITRQIPGLSRLRWGGPMTYAMLAYFGTAVASLMVTNERFVGITTLANYAQYYLILVLTMNFFTSDKRIANTLDLLGVVLGIQALIYCIQSGLGVTFTLTGEVLGAGQVPRPGGTISTRPAAYASFVLPLIFLCVTRFIAERTTARTIFYAAIPALLGITTIVLTYTRAAWGSLVIGLCFVALLSYRRKLLSVKKLAIIALFGVIMASFSAPMIMARFAEAPLDDSYAERKALMDMAVTVIRKKPLLGVGPGAYEHTYKKLLGSEFNGKWMFTVHNQYLLHSAETGLLGGLSFVALLISGFWLALRVSRSLNPTLQMAGIGCAATIPALCFEMYWDIWTGAAFNTMLWFLFGLMSGAYAIYRRQEKPAGALP